ncbi:Polyketide synthase [Hyphodiscus hymeniophilus]|uniref:Polyketide synthase n=1 Tax=Hyphodiscus hymeniophilus TaxID=353542 RepID=A0A9P6VE29_9HELO|nr:Polyketide synthase [Hyphodiscus hymeniophilus]
MLLKLLDCAIQWGRSIVYKTCKTAMKARGTHLALLKQFCSSWRGSGILFYKDSSLLMESNDQSSPVIALSISGSTLAAAAAAVANSVSELIDVATFLAVVSCRLGVMIGLRGREIEVDGGCWAFSAVGNVITELPSILDRFHHDQKIPIYKQAYIGIQATSWVSVFGPPSVLERLIDSSTVLRNSHVVMVPTIGPVHAAHLAGPNLEYMIGETPLLTKKIKSNYYLISGSTNRPIVVPSLRNLLHHILEDIFQHSTNPDRVFEAGISLLNRGQKTSLFVLGNTSYVPSFKRMLQKERLKVGLESNVPTQEKSENHVRHESIAIVGMSGRFPGSDTVEGLWKSIMEQEEHHQKIPPDRFDVDSYADETGRAKNAITAPYGCFLEHPGHFDHKMFNFSPREAMQMDPAQRLLLHTTYEALEDAGVTTNGSRSTDAKRVSTFIGIGGDDWREIHESLGVDILWPQGNQRAFAPGRLNHYFNWEGATFCVDSACGCSASAVGLAFKALMNRDCDTAIAGGSNIIATPFWHSALSRGGYLSPTGGCKPFREDADGYCRGEAVAVLVLKRLDDALQDNDNIISVIRGYARNHSAETKSITHPHAQTQERLYRSLLNKTGIEPHDIGYVECHGTGTTAGDSTELESVANVFARPGSRERPLVVGAIKANMGHSEATAGILSIIKGALVLQKQAIPAQPGIAQNLGRYPSLENGQIVVPAKTTPFSHLNGQGKKRRILVNNFDAAGGNSCFVLEEPPNSPTKSLDPRAFHIVTISALSMASLEQNKRRMLHFLKGNDSVNLANLAYTTTARRNHHHLRAAYSGASIEDVAVAVSNDLSGVGRRLSSPDKKSPLIFVFSGQGGSYAGMGKDLFQTSNQFRGIIAELERICDFLGFPSFTSLIANPTLKTESVSIVQLHLSLVALEIALTKFWALYGIKPDIVMGHSIGEYAALCAAGILSSFDTLYLVGKRAQLLQSKCVAGTRAMLSISGIDHEIGLFLSEEIPRGCEVSCFNGPGMIVLSGEQQNILATERALKERGFKCKLLDIPYAMHSCQMDALLPEFESILRGVRFCKPKIKMMSTLLGYSMADNSSIDGDYLVRQTREPVNFQGAVTSCIREGLADASAVWLEIGPDASCTTLIRSNINSKAANYLTSLRKNENDWKSISVTLATLYMSKQLIHWRAFHSDYIDSLSLIDLPKYSFDTRDFWITYKSSDQEVQLNGSIKEKESASLPISTCLHDCVERSDDGHQQSASFTSAFSHTSYQSLLQGHKISGISVCSAGVFIDMAITAAQYLMTGGDLAARSHALVVWDLQVDRPIIFTSNDPPKVIRTNVTRQTHTGMEFSVSFHDDSKTLSSAFAKCLVRPRNEPNYGHETQNLTTLMKTRTANLMAASEEGMADRYRSKVFYKLFSNLMEYSDLFKGIDSAIVSDDFREITANVTLPVHNGKGLEERFVLSPYWIDIVGQTLGFLLNGNPNEAGDYVYIGTHVERLEFQARDIQPGASYQIHGYIYHSEGSDFRGNAYILHNGVVVGFMEGMRMQKMLRKALHNLLGKVNAPEIKNSPQTTALATSTKSNIDSKGPTVLENGPKAKGHVISLAAIFLRILLEETGLLESEVLPSAYFSEIGVDSIFSISILAKLKAESGIELGTSFMTEHPTLEEAQRALRMMEHQNSTLFIGDNSLDRHTKEDTSEQVSGNINGQTNGNDVPEPTRQSNVVLMQAASTNNLSTTSLFLIADGAGSAAAYIHLPKIADDVQVFALESPWVKDPKNFNCTFSEAAAIYLAAIRSKQPRGPYLLGGWSGGGVFAYEVSRLMLEAGEKVIGLIIIDIPAPRYVDKSKVPTPTFELIEEMGMLVGIERTLSDTSPLALQLKEHMLGTVRCFSKLDPKPMAPGHQPDASFIIWATEDLGKQVGNDGKSKSSEMGFDAWFYPLERDSGPNGWDSLVGDKVECFQTPGDHFSIMTIPRVRHLGHILQEVVMRCLGSVV